MDKELATKILHRLVVERLAVELIDGPTGRAITLKPSQPAELYGIVWEIEFWIGGKCVKVFPVTSEAIEHYAGFCSVPAGTFPGDEYTICNARYAKNCVLIKCPSADGFKTRAGALAEALNGRWTNRERGYVMSRSKARRFETLFAEGWDGSLFGELRAPEPKAVPDYPPQSWLMGATRQAIAAGVHPTEATAEALDRWRVQGERAAAVR